jgi:uncharacterized protein YdeI (BOF family)
MTALAISILFGIPTTAAAADADPYALPDETWISISGTIASPTDDSFLLDYGEGVVTVEMDDWDSYGEARALMDGDDVTVYGRVDDGLYERTTIEASSVYVANLNTYFYADDDDEEGDAHLMWQAPSPLIITATTSLRGRVSSVNPEGRTFTIDTGERLVTVDTWGLGYNPLDDAGFQKVDKGDIVHVTGHLDTGFFEKRELDADSVITLRKNTGS